MTTRPKPIKKIPEDAPILQLCEKYLDELEMHDGTTDFESDVPIEIFETMMEYYYGKDVWNYVNDKL